MGGSGLLVVGVVLLWLFGAMPHWLRRREELAIEHEIAEAESRELVMSGRPGSRASGESAGASSAGLLRRAAASSSPVPVATDGGRAQGKAPAPHPAAAQPVPAPAPGPVRPVVQRRRRVSGSSSVLAVLLAVGAVLTAGPTLVLLAVGVPAVTAAVVGLGSVVIALAALRLRARRAIARTAVLRRAGVRRPLTVLDGQGVPRPAAGVDRVDHAAAAREERRREAQPRRQAVGA